MANSLYFYTPDWSVKEVVQLNSNADIEGVCFDGFYFWTVEGILVCQYFITPEKVPTLVSSFDASSLFSDLDSLTCICTDGVDLYIGAYFVYTGFPAPAPDSAVFKVSKYGSVYSELYRYAGISNRSDVISDLTFDGLNLYWYKNESVGNSGFVTFDVATKKIVSQVNLGINIESIAWNGVSFYAGIRIARGRMINHAGNLLQANVVIPKSMHGLDFGTVGLNINGFMDKFDGEWIVGCAF